MLLQLRRKWDHDPHRATERRQRRPRSVEPQRVPARRIYPVRRSFTDGRPARDFPARRSAREPSAEAEPTTRRGRARLMETTPPGGRLHRAPHPFSRLRATRDGRDARVPTEVGGRESGPAPQWGRPWRPTEPLLHDGVGVPRRWAAWCCPGVPRVRSKRTTVRDAVRPSRARQKRKGTLGCRQRHIRYSFPCFGIPAAPPDRRINSQAGPPSDPQKQKVAHGFPIWHGSPRAEIF